MEKSILPSCPILRSGIPPGVHSSAVLCAHEARQEGGAHRDRGCAEGTSGIQAGRVDLVNHLA